MRKIFDQKPIRLSVSHLLDNQLYKHHLYTWNDRTWRQIRHKTPFWLHWRNKVVRVYVWARLWMGAILWRSTTQCCDGLWWIDAARSHWAVARRRLPHKTSSYVAGGSIEELIATNGWVWDMKRTNASLLHASLARKVDQSVMHLLCI